RLHGEGGVIVHRDIRQIGPGAFVAGLVALRVVPAVLYGGEVVGIGDRFGVLMANDDAVAVKDPVAEAVADYIHRIHPAATLSQSRPVCIEEGNERILQPVGIAQAIHAVGLGVIAAIDRLTSCDGGWRREDDVG